ncbi:transmembrane protein 220 [Oncorhynchus tshawytscha]|uniref:Transmembrane protein 220 n=1 Tax=Oncorhynchus tshawytscha TaxID=74940 RepID=A0A8C8I4G7_ONCTS|nr:transmembrane protein 220 [Oncorhynchus tshawytscha]
MNEPSEVRCTKTKFSLIIWRVCNVCMSLFFALASYVQINDPDAVLWMVAYAIPANLCLLIAIKPHVTETLLWRRIAKLHMLISTAVVSMMGWTLYKEHITNIFQQEEGREFSGLMLILVWLLLCQHSGSSIGALRLSVAVAITIFPFVAWLYYYINKELRTSWPPHCKAAL